MRKHKRGSQACACWPATSREPQTPHSVIWYLHTSHRWVDIILYIIIVIYNCHFQYQDYLTDCRDKIWVNRSLTPLPFGYTLWLFVCCWQKWVRSQLLQISHTLIISKQLSNYFVIKVQVISSESYCLTNCRFFWCQEDMQCSVTLERDRVSGNKMKTLNHYKNPYKKVCASVTCIDS